MRQLSGVIWLAAALAVVGTVIHPVGAGAATHPSTEYYVSIGDSYAAGYQPTRSAAEHRDTEGFAYQVVAMAAREGRRLTLRNFACGGATSATVVEQAGCSVPDPGPDDVAYPGRTQAAAADAFVADHAGKIGLITVSIGGNDLLSCTSAAIMDPCLTGLMPTVSAHLATLLSGLRQAAGPDVPIVGLTYPDVLLGLHGSHQASERNLALVSVGAFGTIFNPALQSTYQAAGATFIDITTAAGGAVPLTKTTTVGGHAEPTAVADVCTLTYYCTQGDVHPTARGYRLMAALIVARLGRP